MHSKHGVARRGDCSGAGGSRGGGEDPTEGVDPVAGCGFDGGSGGGEASTVGSSSGRAKNKATAEGKKNIVRALLQSTSVHDAGWAAVTGQTLNLALIQC